MAQGLNRIYLLGMLSERPELRYTRGGRPVLRMRLGTEEEHPDGEGNLTKRVQWHEVVIPGGRAEALAAALGPGTRVLVEGAIRSRTFDARDGTKRTRHEVVARHIWLLSGVARASRPSSSGARYGMPDSPWDAPVFSDDGQGKLF
ncbi:MAG: single-stranded DNA-binding protein [Deltaproteobacteria bacterium]|jgi:single-strand DNA-binding protein|nr:single-stranded DNA-binding protein [Deltaproteobacteria bacterium]